MQNILPRLEVLTEPPFADADPGSDRRSARRGLALFVTLFVLGCVASLAFSFARPAVYRSTATLLIEPPRAERSGQVPSLHHVAVERQILIGHPLLTQVLEQAAATHPDGVPTGASELRELLSATGVGDTYMVELAAEGSDPALLYGLLDTWIEVYLETRSAARQDTSDATSAELRGQLAALEERIAGQRLALDEFRSANAIVSGQRDDHEAVARLKGLNEALNQARREQAAAAARLAALQQSIARGNPVLPDQYRAQLAALGEQASRLRGQLRQFERRFTREYMAIDPAIVAVRDDLERLEGLIRDRQQAALAATLGDAEQALAGAELNVVRLEEQLAGYQQTAARFEARFAEYDALQQELAQLEQLHRQVKERLVQSEVAARENYPRVSVLEQPFLPDAPIRPHYLRDAGIGVAGSLALALLALLIHELLTRPGRGRPPREDWPRVYSFSNTQVFPPPAAERLPEVPAEPAPVPAAAPAAALQPELAVPEVAALLAAADPKTRLLIGLLLSGPSATEAAALRWAHFDRETGKLYVPGHDARSLDLLGSVPGWFAALAAAADAAAAPVWTVEDGTPLDVSGLAAMIACAAHDAGLADPARVTPERLRHTYLAYLVRQGVRLTELERVAGRLPPGVLAAYGQLSPPTPGVALERIERLFPALRPAAATAAAQ